MDTRPLDTPFKMPRAPRSHGTGRFELSQLAAVGAGVVIEEGVRIFHPENVYLGDGIYIGHGTLLKAYYKNKMTIGSGTWIGQGCFFHSAGGIDIGEDVGIGPGVKILTSSHEDPGRGKPIMAGEIIFEAVSIGAGSDIGVGAIILPGVRVGVGVQVGAGAIVTRDIPDFSVVAGNPARILRTRQGG